jgi:hypothetical protein
MGKGSKGVWEDHAREARFLPQNLWQEDVTAGGAGVSILWQMVTSALLR